MAEPLFNTNAVLQRLAQAVDDQPVAREITRRVNERLGEMKGEFPRIARVGAEALSPAFSLPEASYDALVAEMILSVVNDAPLFVHACLHALRPDGVLLLTALGAESFREFRQAWAAVGEGTGHVIPLTDVRELGSLLQRLKVALPVVDRDLLTLTFPDFSSLYKAIRSHGSGNLHPQRNAGLTTPRQFQNMEAAYRRLFPREDGRLPLTLEIVYAQGFKPAANQPRAATRGSGKVSLVRILGE